MVKVAQIYDFLDSWAPFSTQMDFDNAGLLVGSREAETGRVLVALDVTSEVVREAVRRRCGLLLSHHPLIFHPLKAVTEEDSGGALVRELVRRDISLISAHTNLDIAPGGVNDALMAALGIPAQAVLEPLGQREGIVYGLGRLGRLDAPMAPRDFARRVKTALGARGMRVALGQRPVSQVAVCGGAGGDMVALAVSQGADAFVTADVKHHEFLEARARGLTLIDGGHFATENVIVPVLCRRLREEFGDRLEVLTSTGSKEPAIAL